MFIELPEIACMIDKEQIEGVTLAEGQFGFSVRVLFKSGNSLDICVFETAQIAKQRYDDIVKQLREA